MKISSYIFTFIIIIICFSSCEKEGSHECDNVPIPEEFVNKKRYYLLANGLNDTLVFKKFRKIQSGEYIYIGEEIYIGTDSSVQNLLVEKPIPDQCHDEKYINIIHLTFSGPNNLDLSLIPNGDLAKLRILFFGKEFQVSGFQEGKNTIPELILGNSTFYEVNYMSGYTEGLWGDGRNYIDSTYAYYNLNRGIVKFIINDTLKFERVLK